MLSNTSIPMPPSRNMKIPLNLIQIHTPKNPTAIRRPLNFRRLLPPRLLLPRRNNIMNMLLPEPFLIVPGARLDVAVRVRPQLMHALGVRPLAPRRVLPLEQHAREDGVARRVLDVDVQVPARHAHYHVDVDLHRAPYALFDGEGVVFLAAPPTA